MIWYIISHPLGYCSGTQSQIMQCKGYNLWSGIVSDISEITLITMFVGIIMTWYKTSRCHVDERAIGGKNCLKRGKYPFQHFKLCKKHHPATPDSLTHLHITKLHKLDKS